MDPSFSRVGARSLKWCTEARGEGVFIEQAMGPLTHARKMQRARNRVSMRCRASAYSCAPSVGMKRLSLLSSHSRSDEFGAPRIV